MRSLLLSRRDLDFLLHEWLDVEALTKRDALRRAQPGDVRRGARPVRAGRRRALRPAQQGGRPRRAPLRRRAGAHAPRGGGRAARLRRDRHRRRRPAREPSAACSCRTSWRRPAVRLVPGGQRRRPSAYPFLTIAATPTCCSRTARPSRSDLRPPRCSRAASSARCACRSRRPGSSLADITTRAEPRGRRHLPAVRHQDVDLRRRPRAVREHRPPGAGQDPRRAGRGEGHLAVRRAEVPRTTTVAASATTSSWPGSTTRWATAARPTPLLNFGEGRAHAGRAGRRRRLPGRRAAPRPRLHVPHDERGADRRRRRRDGAGLHRLPARSRLRAHPHAGPPGRGARTRRRRRCRSSSTPTSRRMLLAAEVLRRGRARAGPLLRPAARRAAVGRDRRGAGAGAACCSTCSRRSRRAGRRSGASAANDLAIQVHGGYGYTREYAVEQFYRDNRLNPIHEGTHGIQALDLLGRKVVQAGRGRPGAARRGDHRRRRARPRRRRGRLSSRTGSAPPSAGSGRSPRRCGAPATSP